MMLFKIVRIIAIFTPICMGEILPKISQERSNNQASSSVNFHRQDVPLSYQYSALHPQASTTKDEYKPLGHRENQKQNPNSFRSLQYAPLIKPGELLLQNTKFNKAYHHDPENLLDPEKFKLDESPSPSSVKRPLEPRLEELSSTPPAMDSTHSFRGHSMSHLDYIPGHNIEVLRAVNRYPAHNAVYRSYTDKNPTNADRKNKPNFLNQYYVHPNLRENEYTTSFSNHVNLTKTTTPKITPAHSTTSGANTTKYSTPKPYKITYDTPKQYYIPKPITYIVEKPISLAKVPYTKMHSLLLNVARSYGLAMSPYKIQHPGNSPNLLDQAQNFGLTNQNYNFKPLMKVPGSSKLNPPYSEKKTLLYPVQKNVHFK